MRPARRGSEACWGPLRPGLADLLVHHSSAPGRSHGIWAVAISIAAGLGCGQSSGSPLAVPRRTVDSRGTVVVQNSGPTRWTDTSGWRLRQVRVVEIPETGACGFGRLSSAITATDGSIVVAGTDPLGIAVFDSLGHCLRRIGREGSGPGEFRYVRLGTVDGDVLVHDPMEARLTRFRPDGSLVETRPAPCCVAGPLLQVLRDGRVAIPLYDDGRLGWARLASDGSADTVWAPAPSDGDPGAVWRFSVPDGRSASPRPASVPIPYSASSVAEIRPAGDVVWGRTDRYRLVVGAGTDTSLIIEAPATAVPIPDSLRRLAYDFARSGGGVLAFRGPLSRIVRESDIPRHWPLWDGARTDDDGRIWVAVPAGGKRVGLLHVFDSSGAMLGAVPIPHPQILRAAWLRHTVILAETDDEGHSQVRVFTLDTTRTQTTSFP